MVVLVEKWLNDDDFKAAEERGDIFSPKKEEPEEVSVVEVASSVLDSHLSSSDALVY